MQSHDLHKILKRYLNHRRIARNTEIDTAKAYSNGAKDQIAFMFELETTQMDEAYENGRAEPIAPLGNPALRLLFVIGYMDQILLMVNEQHEDPEYEDHNPFKWKT